MAQLVWPEWKMGKELRNDLESFNGPVVTRFPPEPSGYLHVGHAKALYINQAVADYKLNGRLRIRFDDTNPNNESNHFEDEMTRDMHLLIPELFRYTISHTSDYFGILLRCADTLITDGLAYVDFTDPVTLKQQRLKRIDSDYRSVTVEKNTVAWEKMKQGTVTDCILRLKLDMKSKNGCMRDPMIYRGIDAPHNRTGSKFKVYPSYDFSCPIVDSLEGITHVFRSTEFTDRDSQYRAILEIVKLPCPKLYGYGKLIFKDAILSKRKIKAFIESGDVESWDSPKLLTLQGARRRGLHIQGLVNFLSKIGITRSIVEMAPANLWAANQKFIDKISTRYQAIACGDTLLCTVNGINVFENSIQKFNRNAELGDRPVIYSDEILLNRCDSYGIEINEEVTLMNWGNAIITKFESMGLCGSDPDEVVCNLHLEGDYKLTKKKIRWVTSENFVKVKVVEYSSDIMDAPLESFYFGETAMKLIVKGECIQLLRMHYYICDVPYNEALKQDMVLIQIPSGR
ncbi:MAG: glutamate--tRNA ligase family protein [Methylococcales bacterium]